MTAKVERLHDTREAWLVAAIELLRPLFDAAGATVPERVVVSVGFPGGRNIRKTIGQCWKTTAASDGLPHVFVSPVLADPLRVLTTLTHELVHASDDCVSGHRGAFVRTAKVVGLVKPWTESNAGEDLAGRLRLVLHNLGPYGHGAIVLDALDEGKQTTRMLKVECPSCGCIMRTSKKWLDLGLPTCACGVEMVAA